MKSEDLFEAVSNPKNFTAVLSIINTMEKDTLVGPLLLDMLNKRQVETRTFVYWAAQYLQPQNYLEIGVRRGWSLGMVCTTQPQCDVYAFDSWSYDVNYRNSKGPQFVADEMKKLGYQKNIHFINGDSHQTVPKFFQENPEIKFDLILVDGDHSAEGALDDLKNTMPHLNKNGILLFDDIVLIEELNLVFEQIKDIFPKFEYHSYTKNSPGIGVIINTA